MIETRVICDVCRQPIPIEIVETEFGPAETVKLHRTKEWNTHALFPHLCEGCAKAIDESIAKVRTEMLQEIEIAKRNAKLNAERKKQMETKEV